MMNIVHQAAEPHRRWHDTYLIWENAGRQVLEGELESTVCAFDIDL